MMITRIYTDDQGETHFDEIEEPDVEFRGGGAYTRQIDTYGVAFRRTEPMGDEPALGDWHTAPQRQYILFLQGETAIEVSDGEKRTFRTGDVFLVEDTTGKGHRNRRLFRAPELWAQVRSHKDT